MQIPQRSLLFLLFASIWPSLGFAQQLVVSVRERSGEPLTAEAIVHLDWPGHGVIVGTTGGGNNQESTVTFNVETGEFDIEAEAVGYDKATEHATVSREGSRQMVYVFLTRTGSAPSSAAPTGITLTPNVQKELQKAVEEIKRAKYDDARKHLGKALKMAPSSPDILYMLGILDYTIKDYPAARKQFESISTSYPTHARSLLMLGQMQLEAKEYKEAKGTLKRAVEADDKNWRAHYLYALASAQAGDLPNGRIEAARASELNPEKAAAMKLLTAKLLMLEGKNELAIEGFQSFIKTYPQDPAVPNAKKYIENMEAAKKAGAGSSTNAAESLKPAAGETAPSEFGREDATWAPPDVDAGIPPTAVGVTCSADSVLENAQQRIMKQLGDLEKFSATERVEHQEMDSGGVWSKLLSRDFYYMISVFHNPKLPYYFVEDRTTDSYNSRFPTGIATRGLVSLGFMIVNPGRVKDYEFSCEGLGNWNGKPAWQLHFVQKKDATTDLRSWEYKGSEYLIPLKGRIWIAANSFSILHLETALREPVAGLRLNREQLTVDYGPIRSKTTSAELWLPIEGQMYFDLMKHRYHHKHSLSNYLFFGVDTKNKIKVPTPPSPPEQ